MPEPLLKLLELCLLALLWLFFLRVLRAVWTEVRGPAATAGPVRAGAGDARPRRAPKGKGPKRGTPRLVVVEPDDQRGRAFDLVEEMTVGRAAGCQIVLDDTYVSQLHTRIFQRDGQLMVDDLGSTNGTYLNNRKVSGPMMMNRGDKLRVGKTVMELQ